MYVYIHICVYIYYIYTCMYIYICIHIYLHTYMNMYIYNKYIYVYLQIPDFFVFDSMYANDGRLAFSLPHTPSFDALTSHPDNASWHVRDAARSLVVVFKSGLESGTFGVLQVCCCVLFCVAVCCSLVVVFRSGLVSGYIWCVAVCCSLLQSLADCCSVLQCLALCFVLQPVTV